MEKSLTKKFNIPGTKVGSQNAQLFISSGISALDTILGGGLPVGTLCLIEEDIYGTYSNIMFKYFIAEGIASNHSTFIASLDTNPFNIIKKLPAVIKSDSETSLKINDNIETDKMQIAFRYQNLPTKEKEEPSFSHHFDLSKTININDTENSEIFYWNSQRTENGCNMFLNPAYNELLKSIKNVIKDGKFFLKDNPEKRSILRIGLHSLGSAMWLPSKKSFQLLDTSRDLNMFIFCLRALVRSAYAVAFITIPSHFYHEDSLERCIHSSDIAMRLQVFSGTELETNASLSDYQGFFHLTKLAAINSFASKHPGSIEYVFKCRRKKFLIEKLHLPPDVQESHNEESIMSCGSSRGSILDF